MGTRQEVTRTFVATTASGRKYVIEETFAEESGGSAYRLKRTGKPVRRRPDGKYEVWSLDYLILEEVSDNRPS